MSITSTNRTDIGYIKEVTAGTTPASPNFQIIPTTGGSPMSDVSTEVSQVIRSDRMTDDLVVVDLDVMGEMNYELSYAPYEPLLKSALRGTEVTVAVSGASDIEVVPGSPDTLTSSSTDFVAAGIVVGMTIKLSGAVVSSGQNNGLYYVTAVTANSMDVVFEGTTTSETPASVNIDCVFMANGEATIDNYTMVKRVLGITNPTYFYYRGCQISSMSMNFETGSILGGSLGVIGLTEEITETEISSSTYADPPSYDLMNSVSSVTDINITGLAGTTSFSTMNLTMDNNINAAKAIGTLGAVDLAAFTLDVMADISIYFEDKTLYDYYKNSTAFSARFTLQDASGNQIVVSMPKCKFETLETPIDGKDNFFMANGSMRILRDSTANHMISFSFFPAP